MPKLLLLGVSVVILANVCQSTHLPTYTADKGYLQKQKSIYELFWHVDQPTLYHPELYQTAKSFSIEDNASSFNNKEVVQEFLQRWKYGMLPRGRLFSMMHRELRDEAMIVFRLFYYAKDFDTFYRTAVWARFNINEQMYLYTLYVAVLHRPDTKYIYLPPLYEVFPNFFFNDEVMHNAYRMQMQTDVKDARFVQANYTGWYLASEEKQHYHQLAYFTEDLSLNSFYFWFNHEYPYWMSTSEFKFPEVNARGEVYLFGHKQLLVRYQLERLSHDLGDIPALDWHDLSKTAEYHPYMHHYNGLPFPIRENHPIIPDYLMQYLEQLEDVHHRIANAIDSGYILDHTGKQMDIYKEFSYLGNIIEGNADSYNQRFYKSFDRLLRRIFGFGGKPISKYQTIPSALEIYCTSMRDPMFYSIYKKIIDSYYLQYKKNLPSYTHDQLAFPGVKVESVTVDKLVTYFDEFQSMLSNGIPVHDHIEARSKLIMARQNRLNHKPFSYHISLNSDKDQKAVIRIFLGPKYDVHGHELDIAEHYMNFLQLDQWMVDLKIGKNKIERSSHESTYAMDDEMPSDVLYEKIVKALDGGESFSYNHQHYGFPQRLMLPIGKKEGMPFKLFVIVSIFNENHSVKFESPIWGETLVDGSSLGYPFDRPVYSYNFTQSNMYFKDVLIYHKNLDEQASRSL